MRQPFLNAAARDFDAYAPEKATSNAYARPRLEVKQRALAWGRSVVARLAKLGLAVDLHASDEHPSVRNQQRVDCQWVFFWRDQAGREALERRIARGRAIADELDDPSPYARHVFLALRIDAQGIEVCFALHPNAEVDVENLDARLRDEGGALEDEVVAALGALPEQFRIGVGATDRAPCSSITRGALRGLLARAASADAPLWIGWSVPRDVAIAHAAILDEQLEDALVALAPLYKLVAWSPDNDRLAGHRSAHPPLAVPPPAVIVTRLAPARRPPLTRPPTQAPAAALDRGAKVRVLSGAFADKVGVIGELDGRGGAHVLLGLLSTRLDLVNLEPVLEQRERPALQSSHRRPSPAPRKAR